jgi:hypothetical protein
MHAIESGGVGSCEGVFGGWDGSEAEFQRRLKSWYVIDSLLFYMRGCKGMACYGNDAILCKCRMSDVDPVSNSRSSMLSGSQRTTAVMEFSSLD